ncbi:MAG: HIT family protein [Caulobacteraceae bacterium]|nr:HIT family protein [Caulobacteraceae bacterium]
MSLEGAYDENNIFARILRGELPAVRLVEDADTLAFMDAFPQARGHALVIHRRARARNLLDASPGELNAVMATVQRLARAIVAGLAPDGLVVTQFNGAPAGQTVFHLHIHLIPRWTGTPLARHAGAIADPAELEATAAKIRARLE